MAINKLNAPRAISKSAIIYSLRCMVGYDIPLNQGCLAPIPVNIPKWSILDPDIQISGRPQELPASPVHWRRRGFEEDSLLKQLNAVSVVY
ncbi:5-oxoprolinase-like isoform X2 [Clavelina lepadiformis]|uniref:5-oxoprolinase-like isoform X2 n=1 Tax=Clavelina lepadiformis TaxID=159417 RepID=UPI0040422F29